MQILRLSCSSAGAYAAQDPPPAQPFRCVFIATNIRTHGKIAVCVHTRWCESCENEESSSMWWVFRLSHSVFPGPGHQMGFIMRTYMFFFCVNNTAVYCLTLAWMKIESWQQKIMISSFVFLFPPSLLWFLLYSRSRTVLHATSPVFIAAATLLNYSSTVCGGFPTTDSF